MSVAARKSRKERKGKGKGKARQAKAKAKVKRKRLNEHNQLFVVSLSHLDVYIILFHKHVHIPIEWNLYVVAIKGKKIKIK